MLNWGSQWKGTVQLQEGKAVIQYGRSRVGAGISYNGVAFVRKRDTYSICGWCTKTKDKRKIDEGKFVCLVMGSPHSGFHRHMGLAVRTSEREEHSRRARGLRTRANGLVITMKYCIRKPTIIIAFHSAFNLEFIKLGFCSSLMRFFSKEQIQ